MNADIGGAFELKIENPDQFERFLSTLPVENERTMDIRDAALNAAAWVNSKFDCGAEVGDEAVIACGDPRVEVLEHVCHELAHAVTLGVRLGPHLSSRIGKAIGNLHADDADAEENEVEAHVIVMGVFARLGLECDRVVFLDAALTQVTWGAKEIQKAWREYERTWRCRAAVAEVLAIILELA